MKTVPMFSSKEQLIPLAENIILKQLLIIIQLMPCGSIQEFIF